MNKQLIRSPCIHNGLKKVSYSLQKHTNNKNMLNALNNSYIPYEIEKDCDNNGGYFHSHQNLQQQFNLLLPPPNVTGTLHLGHAFAAAIQDVLARWYRMRGIQTLWIPGLDHAGIATQVMLEKKLWNEKKQTRHDIGKDEFLKEIWKWKDDKANIIDYQLKQMGASLDWSRQFFTMDPVQSYAVTEAFIKLYECGLIYRSDYLVNWSCTLGSAIADIEVEHMKVSGSTMISTTENNKPVEFGILTKFAYKLCDSDQEVVVATTRPETILGDVAVAVHPNDARYSSFIGKMCWHPFRNEKIPVICDDLVNSNFGTGAVKVTPAHDYVDFEIGKRHGLKTLHVIDEKGNVDCKPFSKMNRFDIRTVIVNELQRLNLLRDRHDHDMTVPICSRSKGVIEYLLKPQWFLKCSGMAIRALDDLKKGNIEIEPKHFEKDWNHWLENIRDWCISRQLWWGHRIPMYFCHTKRNENDIRFIAAHNIQTAKSKAASKLACESSEVIALQDEDTLDTWFSSALLPFSVFGWPQQTNDLKQYYPLSLMETGHDILFFWVARMVMLGTFLTGQLPFSKILLHGIVCDAQGRKMSKSLGNVIAPEDVILGSSLQELETKSRISYKAGLLTRDELEKALSGQKKMFPEGIPDCGSDALRFTLCSHNIKNRYISFNVQECKVNKFFGNKIWQAVKFTNKWIDAVSQVQEMKELKYEALGKLDKWILSRLCAMVEIVNHSLEKYEFHTATNAMKNFLYYELCDVYLETTKRGFRENSSSIACNHCWSLSVCLDVGLRCLAPFMPRLSQHLHQRLITHPYVQRRYDFPEDLPWRNISIEEDVEKVLEVVISIRRLKKIFNLTAKDEPKVFLVSQLPIYMELRDVIEDLTKCDEIIINEVDTIAPFETIVDNVGNNVIVHLLLPKDVKHAFKSDLPKLEMRRSKLLTELNKIKQLTSTEGYKLKASTKTQEGNLNKMMILEEKIARIDSIQKLSKSFGSN